MSADPTGNKPSMPLETAVPTGAKPRSPDIREGVTLSVAPMMERGENSLISVAYMATCAIRVQPFAHMTRPSSQRSTLRIAIAGSGMQSSARVASKNI